MIDIETVKKELRAKLDDCEIKISRVTSHGALTHREQRIYAFEEGRRSVIIDMLNLINS
jgi:hypothetical protein